MSILKSIDNVFRRKTDKKNLNGKTVRFSVSFSNSFQKGSIKIYRSRK